ncbi:MAG: hypothetical protein LUD14_01455 [Clostridiales bacterium]|nr:hypothetical protein [Clostridiales bacterium]
MSRTAYKNQHIREHYDRINLTVPKGEKARIKAAAESMQISVNEYLYMLVCDDLSEEKSKLAQKKEGFTEEHRRMLDKWQVAEKYRDMIESMHVEEITGMNKHYTIILKEGYINDVTGSRSIHVNKMQELRSVIRKSHKK